MKFLTITGVGPGDPSLLTLAAVDAIKESTVVSYPVSIREGESLAEKIASKWISKDKKKLPLYFPMVDDLNMLKNAWRVAGNELMEMVEKGERVVFLSQGDISLFSTGSYLSQELEKHHPECVVKLIPGVTSFAAAAAVPAAAVVPVKAAPAPDKAGNIAGTHMCLSLKIHRMGVLQHHILRAY